MTWIQFAGINGQIIKIAELKKGDTGMFTLFEKYITAGVYTYSLIVDDKIIETKKMLKQ